MKDFQSLITGLSNRLDHKKLPGLSAQLTMAPETREKELQRTGTNTNARQSAVLILFYPVKNLPHLVFIKRPVDNSVHSGQIAFPGGRVEPEDRDFIDTALREANEEINVYPDSVQVIGLLSKLYIPPSNFDVFPVIGYTNERPVFKGNYEVDKILEISIHELLKPDTKTVKTIHHRLGKLVDVPCFYVQKKIIWGATAMILGELLEVISDAETFS